MTSTNGPSTESAAAGEWHSDRFLPAYDAMVLPLGPDPDGEDPITATLVRAPREPSVETRGAVLYVHGFTDYFFHRPLAEHFTAQGFDFYGLDLRKCGRSRGPQHTPHFTTNLRQYDTELNRSLRVVLAGLDDVAPQAPVFIAAHSTGGLITPLWLQRLRSEDPARHARIGGLVLNSPWFDLQGDPILRTYPITMTLKGLAAVRPKQVIPKELSNAYGESLHESAHGEWSYDLDAKPMGGFPVTVGFINAVRSGQRRLHRGLDIGVPSLVLRSDKTYFGGTAEKVDRADAVLDVSQIARWSGCLGDRVSVVPLTDARHDVFLSLPEVRARAYAEVDSWLAALNHSQHVSG